MKKVGYGILAAILLSSMVACSPVFSDQSSYNSKAKAAGNKVSSINGKYSIVLPESWEDFYRVEQWEDEKATQDLNAEEVMTVTFQYKDNPQISETLFQVYAISEKEWKKMNKADAVPFGEVLAEKDDIVYVISLPLSNPFASHTNEGRKYEEMANDLNTVIKSFTMEKG
ncbi:hypothetical protein J9303_01480 [Bacillaceae bacterium Marseille-Q3522]|nr:hypothetical protein [Bacillaceae bacterium Marseille-Q3522]